ncbi:MAG: hypothetical protein GXP62_04710 [Oligoflexia bacterium]|nr:hypothetical protein [Oligoflexia bacterium]
MSIHPDATGAMDKTRKLRRYHRKDYSQVVEFPVEIVGRDGVVRRYSFEDSIRLYQRRVASAPSRYGDAELAQAEAEHCQRRIGQLRRSYLERYGGDALRRSQGLGRIPGLAGEVTAFLRRCLDRGGDLEGVEVGLLDTVDPCQIFGVRVGDGMPAVILYLYTFEDDGDCISRDAFFAQVKLLQQVRRCGQGVEALVAFHHTADFGLVLSGSCEAAAMLAERVEHRTERGWNDDVVPAAAQQDDAMARLRRGDAQGALRAFERLYERDHYRRTAYIGAAVVADQIGQFEAASLAAEMGSRYFPQDPALAWHLAVARLRRGQVDAASDALTRAHALEGDAHAVLLLQALVALRQRRIGVGRQLLLRAARCDPGTDRALAHTRRRVRLALWGLLTVRWMSLIGCIAGVITLVYGHQQALLATAVFATIFLIARPIWQVWLRSLVGQPGARGISLASVATLQVASQQRRATEQ